MIPLVLSLLLICKKASSHTKNMPKRFGDFNMLRRTTMDNFSIFIVNAGRNYLGQPRSPCFGLQVTTQHIWKQG